MTRELGAFAQGHVSVGLYLYEATPATATGALRAQARAAIAAGFDGVTIPEHHGGRPGYLANPVLASAVLLAESAGGWYAAAPTIGPLRSAALLAEDVAWIAAAFPGRFGLATGSGYDIADFTAVDAPFEGRLGRFRQHCIDLAAMLRHGDEPRLRADLAIAYARTTEVPLLVATRGPRTTDFAAKHGYGLFLPPLPARVARELVDRYREHGGRAPVTVTRWMWIGEHPAEGEARLNNNIGSTPGDLSWRDDDSIIRVDSSTDPVGLAESMADLVAASGGTNLNLRFHLPGMAPELVVQQLELAGPAFLPALRSRLTTGASQ